MKLKLIVLQIRGVRATTEGADLPAEAVGRIDTAVRALANYFLLFQIHVGSVVHIGNERVEIYSEDDDSLMHNAATLETALSELTNAFCSNHHNVCERYQAAMEKNVPVGKRREDAKTLALNEALWDAIGAQGRAELLPDEAPRRQIVPRDPTLLRAVRQDEIRQFLIRGALIKGVRIVGAFHDDMFPNLEQEVNAIVTLDGETPEICHRLKVRELQQLFIGYTLVNARVEGRRGQVPKVCGEFSCERR